MIIYEITFSVATGIIDIHSSYRDESEEFMQALYKQLAKQPNIKHLTLTKVVTEREKIK